MEAREAIRPPAAAPETSGIGLHLPEHYFRRFGGATFAALTLAAMGPAEPSQLVEKLPTPAAKLAAPIVASLGEILPINAVGTAEANRNRTDCTYLRNGEEELVIGKACRSDGDKFIKIVEPENKKWPYGAVFIKKLGVYKCAHVRRGILPRINRPRRGLVSFCRDIKNVVNSRFGLLKDYNCGERELRGRRENLCDDGTYFTRILEHCRGSRGSIYGNFTPPFRGALNVYGKRLRNAFSGLISRNTDVTGVHYRAKIKPWAFEEVAGQQQKVGAAVVRTRDVDNRSGWGLGRNDCFHPNQRTGGPPSPEFE